MSFRRYSFRGAGLAGARVVVVGGILVLGAASASGAVPGANGNIAFTSERDGNFEIYVMNADGTGAANVSNNPLGDSEPAWSPDGARIALTSERVGDGSIEVYVMNADGTGAVNLTNDPAFDGTPAWSQDGARIAFRTQRDGNAEVYVMNADGTGATNLTNHAAFDAAPSWSPDGTKIAFESHRAPFGGVYVMNADGSAVTSLSALNDGAPAWSPDGTQIAFHSFRDGQGEIYVMNADGTGQTRLTNDPTNDLFPAWSPDGTKIAFTSERDGNREIHAMNSDGSGVLNLTNNAARDEEPDWQRAPGPVCTWGRILQPVNQVDSATDDGVSAFKAGTRGVVPAKFRLTCDGDVVDTQAEADALGDVTLELTHLGGGTGGADVVIENTANGPANTGNLFRFDDADDLFIYNVSVKGLDLGGYRIRIAGAGDTQDEFFQIV